MLKSYQRQEGQHLETMLYQSRLKSTQPYISLARISAHHILFNRFLIVGFFSSLFLTASHSQSSDVYIGGVYVSNQTTIIALNGEQQTSVYHNQLGRITSLAIDFDDSLCFWSDISPLYNGIYYANLKSFNLDNKINLNPKASRVLGLAVDAVHNNLYWTDEGHSTVEMYSYITEARRTLVFTDIHSPRGIAIDIQNGLLYWNDQKSERIEKSNLDGSGREVIVKNTVYPNHMVAFGNRLYWLNSNEKKLMSISKNGKDEKIEADFRSFIKDDHIFGLTHQKTSESFLVSSLSNKGLIFNVSKSGVQMVQTNLGNLYGLASADANITTEVVNACLNWNVSLQLCTTVASRSVIMCQSYGGLVKIRNSCVNPRNVLLFTLLDYGYIAYVNLDDVSKKSLDIAKDVYFVYKQQRVAALTYDRQSRMVYWSQVHYSGLYECELNCTAPRYLIGRSDGIGIVEGMFYLNGILAFTDYGERILEDGEECAWNRIHLFDAKAKEQKRIYTILEAGKDSKLRAVSYDGRQVVYSDWGQSAKIGKVTNLKSNSIIRSGLSNPNGLIVSNNIIYFVDSYYKFNQKNQTLSKMAELIQMQFNGVIDSTIDLGPKIPFGLAKSPNYGFIISDWKNDQILVASQNFIFQPLLHKLPTAFNIYSSDSDVQGSSSSCSNCDGLCLENKCFCPSNRAFQFDRLCQRTNNFILFSDLTSIKILNLDTPSENLVTIVNEDMYKSNLMAFTYDKRTQEVYYFNNGYILKVPLWGTYYVQPVYRVNHKIESMIILSNTLYWLDIQFGLLCSLNFLSQPLKHEILLYGLSDPRSLRHHNGFLFWAERGVNPNIFKAALTPSTDTYRPSDMPPKNLRKIIFNVNITNVGFWPNIINFDTNSIYIDNGAPREKQLFKCDSNGANCQNSNTAIHTTDFHISKNSLVYIDPTDQSIKTLSTSYFAKTSLVSNLVRPKKLFVQYDEKNNNVCTRCGLGKCVNLLGVFSYCECNDGYFYHPTLKTCEAKSSYTCSYNGKSYTFSTIVKPSPCLECKCVGEEIASSIRGLNKFVCTEKKCPNLDCPAESRVKRPGECCEECYCESLRFHSCPSSYRQMQLTPFLDYVVDDYIPIVKDCLELPRPLVVTRSPTDNIIKWNKDLGPSEQLFTVTFQGSVDSPNLKFINSAVCTHKVQLIDVSRPVIKCPEDVTVYTFGSEVENVEWMPIKASDNVGIKRISSNPAYGSTFKLGVTRVYYEVTDYSDLTSYCYFDVNILSVPYYSTENVDSNDKRTDYLKPLAQINNKPCVIPIIFNGYIINSNNNLFTIFCDDDYDINTSFPTTYVCEESEFIPSSGSMPKKFRTHACIRKKHRTLNGILPLKLSDLCSQDIYRDYTKKHLLFMVKKEFELQNELKFKVSTHGCDEKKKRRKRSNEELTYQIRIGTETAEHERDQNEQDLITKIETIETRVNSHNIPLVIHYQQNGLQNHFEYGFGEKYFEYLCYDGEVPDDDLCRVCGVGFYSQDGSCLECPENTYNPDEGAVSCRPCPNNGHSKAGSYDFTHCRPKVLESSCGQQCKLGLAIGLPVFFVFLLILFLIIFLCCCFRKKKQKKEVNGINGKNSHKNPHYVGADEIHHEQLEGLSAESEVRMENGTIEVHPVAA